MTTRSFRLSSFDRCGIRIMLLATPLLLASSAYADSISIGFQETGVNGSNIVTLGTGSGGNASVSNKTYGSFTVNDVSAQSRAALGAPGLLNTQSLNISSSTVGVLTVYITAQGLSFTGAQDFVSSFAVNAIHGSLALVQEFTFFSPTNGRYNVGQTLLNSAGFNAMGTAGPFTTRGTTSGTYSVTEQYVFFDIGGASGNDNVTIDLSGTPAPVVPEPGNLLLVGSGLALAGLLYYRRRTKRPLLLISNA